MKQYGYLDGFSDRRIDRDQESRAFRAKSHWFDFDQVMSCLPLELMEIKPAADIAWKTDRVHGCAQGGEGDATNCGIDRRLNKYQRSCSCRNSSIGQADNAADAGYVVARVYVVLLSLLRDIPNIRRVKQ